MQDSGKTECPKHPELTKKVEDIYEVQGSILDHQAKIFEKLETIEKGMYVEVGNGHKITMPIGELVGKLFDNDTIRQATFGRPNIYLVWFKRSFVSLLAIAVPFWMWWYSEISLANQKEQKGRQELILAHQEQMKDWMKIDSSNGEYRDKQIGIIKLILQQKFKIIF